MYLLCENAKRLYALSPQEEQALCEIAGKDEKVEKLLDKLPALIGFYNEKGIPEDILMHTLSDVGIWLRNAKRLTGSYALKEVGWLTNHFEGKLFRLGRLQFIHQKTTVPLPDVGLEPYVLDMHIAEGEPLAIDACLQSFEDAKVFFSRYFPEKPFSAFTIGSWLLDPALQKVLPPQSNLARFGRLFTLVREDGNAKQTFERVFDATPETPLSQLPQRTTLQKNMVAYLQSGGKVTGAAGYILV